jgi:hypothetical protein
MQSFKTRRNFIHLVSFSSVLGLYSLDRKNTVKQTSTKAVHVSFCISSLCVGIHEINLYFLQWPVSVTRCSCIVCTLMFV